MDFKFNANQMVKVNLTDHGIQILKDRHWALNRIVIERGGKGLEDAETYTPPLDEQGYFRTQLWHLFNVFGEDMGLGKKNPFELDIIFEKGEPVETPRVESVNPTRKD